MWCGVLQDVETRVTKDGADTGQYLWDFTRALSTIPYKVRLQAGGGGGRFRVLPSLPWGSLGGGGGVNYPI